MFVVCLGILGCNGIHADSQFSSVNTQRLDAFWSAMDSGTNRVTLLSFGDSMSESYWISAQYFLFGRLRNEYGLGGVTFQNVFNLMRSSHGGGAVRHNSSPHWWTPHYA